MRILLDQVMLAAQILIQLLDMFFARTCSEDGEKRVGFLFQSMTGITGKR
jgi:hypothetical protein